jgi:hypothetical protein
VTWDGLSLKAQQARLKGIEEVRKLEEMDYSSEDDSE